eukprot:6188418-Pleurochrysis_carterae.AAC.1
MCPHPCPSPPAPHNSPAHLLSVCVVWCFVLNWVDEGGHGCWLGRGCVRACARVYTRQHVLDRGAACVRAGAWADACGGVGEEGRSSPGIGVRFVCAHLSHAHAAFVASLHALHSSCNECISVPALSL